MTDKIIKPLGTNRAVLGSVSGINVSQNMGMSAAIAGGMQDLLNKYRAIKDEQMNILGENYYAALVGKSLDYETKMQYDKDYYEQDKNLQQLGMEHEKYTEEFLNLCKENNVNMDIANAYIQAGKNRFQETQEKYLAKHTLWLEDKNREYKLMGLDERANNTARKMISGNYDDGVNDFYQIANEYFTMAERGDIKPSVVIDNLLKQRAGLIYADVQSWINQANGMDELKKMSGMTFEDFDKKYNKLNLKIYGKEILLSDDDFQAFKRGVSGAIDIITSRINAEKELSLYKQDQEIQERKENNYAIESKKYSGTISPREVAEELYTASTNNYYNSTFTNRKEAWDYGRRLKLLDSSNTQEKFYNDKGITGVELINKNLEEHFRYSGGETETNQMMIRDSMSLDYRDRGVKQAFGYSITKSIAKPSSETNKLIANLYTPGTREILDKTKGAKLNITGAIETYETKYIRPITAWTPTPTNTSIGYGASRPNDTSTSFVIDTPEWEGHNYTKLSPFGKLEAMKYVAKNGDIHYEATYKDLEQLAQDTAIIEIFNKTGGVIDKKVAKAIGSEKIEGMLISGIESSDTLNQIFNYYIQNDNDIRKLVQAKLAPVIEENSEGYSFLDTGNGNFISARGIKDESKAARTIYRYKHDNTFTYFTGKNLPNGKPEIKKVRGEEVVAVSRYGENGDEIMFTHRENPVFLGNGMAILKVGDL